MNVGELKKVIADLADDVELAQYGHSGNMLYSAREAEAYIVTEEFATSCPGHNWCEYKAGTTVLIVAEKDG